MEEDALEDAADPNGQDEDELGLGSDVEMEEDEEDDQEKQDSCNQHELKDEDANKSNYHEDRKEESGEEEVKKNIVQNEREKHEGENGDDGKMVPHEEGSDLVFPDSQPILGEAPEPQVWGEGEEKDGEIMAATPPAAQPDIAATPPPTQPDPVIEIEDTPEKSWVPIQAQSVQKLVDRRQAINENISELTEKLNHAKKLIASKCFGLN